MKLMTKQELDFYKKHGLRRKGYDGCTLEFYDTRTRYYDLGDDVFAVETIKTGDVEIRRLTKYEFHKLVTFLNAEVGVVVEYAEGKGLGVNDEPFIPLVRLNGGKMLYYIAKVNKKTAKAAKEEYVVTNLTPKINLHTATEEELEEYDRFLVCADNMAQKAVEEDDRIDHVELASVINMKYKIFPDLFVKDKEGKKQKVCLACGYDDSVYYASGVDVLNMEWDMTQPMFNAARDAALRRLEAYRAKQKE